MGSLRNSFAVNSFTLLFRSPVVLAVLPLMVRLLFFILQKKISAAAVSLLLERRPRRHGMVDVRVAKGLPCTEFYLRSYL